MPKPQDIFQLARQEAVRVTASPQVWQSFLYTAAHNYHTTYLNQLLIHAQRPDAAACASMEYWNTKANRLVMRGSRSITVLQRRQGVAVTKPVFAIGDTTLLNQMRTGGPWEVTDTTRLLLLQGKPDDWLTALAQEGISSEADRARRMLERNVADSTLQWAQPDEQMQLLQALVTQSAVYMARLRIGLPVRDEDYPAFQSVSQFDTCQISLCLGGYVQAAAEPMLNAIGREALRLNRDSIAIPHEPVHNESTRTQLNSREEAVTYATVVDTLIHPVVMPLPVGHREAFQPLVDVHLRVNVLNAVVLELRPVFREVVRKVSGSPAVRLGRLAGRGEQLDESFALLILLLCGSQDLAYIFQRHGQSQRCRHDHGADPVVRRQECAGFEILSGIVLLEIPGEAHSLECCIVSDQGYVSVLEVIQKFLWERLPRGKVCQLRFAKAAALVHAVGRICLKGLEVDLLGVKHTQKLLEGQHEIHVGTDGFPVGLQLLGGAGPDKDDAGLSLIHI